MTKAVQPILEIQNVKKVFHIGKQELEVIADISLDIHEGEFISIVGGSGCGKSTLLNMITSLEDVSAGQIVIDGVPVNGPNEKISMIFQEPRLFPWMTVEQNIEFVLPATISKAERKQLVKEHIDLVGLKGFEKAVPNQLSGGMQQRVSLARALVTKPKLLLLDEPFGALDAFTRMNMQNEVMRIWKEERTTMIMVTHDIDEAVYLGDRVVVMASKPGRIQNIVPVDLPKPRVRTSDEFTKLSKKIYTEFFIEKKPEPEFYL